MKIALILTVDAPEALCPGLMAEVSKALRPSRVRFLDLPPDVLEVLSTAYVLGKEKHPRFPTDPIHAAADLCEESGECILAANQAYNEGAPLSAVVLEALDTAVVAVRIVENAGAFVVPGEQG